MTYVDGFVLVVPKDNEDAYKKMATKAGEIWMKHGALQYLECVGDDLHPQILEEMKDSQPLRFPDVVDASEDETVWFSFIIYKDRKHRDAVNEKVMADPAMEEMDEPMPFDMKRVVFGGFASRVEY